MKLVALVIAAALGVGVSAADAGRIAGARAVPACAAAGPYWPTMTLALGGDTRVGGLQGAVADRRDRASRRTEDGDAAPRRRR